MAADDKASRSRDIFHQSDYSLEASFSVSGPINLAIYLGCANDFRRVSPVWCGKYPAIFREPRERSRNKLHEAARAMHFPALCSPGMFILRAMKYYRGAIHRRPLKMQTCLAGHHSLRFSFIIVEFHFTHIMFPLRILLSCRDARHFQSDRLRYQAQLKA